MIKDSPESSPPELTSTEKLRWGATKSAVTEVGAALATGDSDGLAAALAQLRQIPVDTQRVREAVSLPADAGSYEASLRRLLERIPDGWGRWISCGPGWYPILARLEAELTAIVPEFEVHQIKEKYGSLRFYWGLPRRACCLLFNAENPLPEGSRPTDSPAWAAYTEMHEAHLASETHVAIATETASRFDRASCLVRSAEAESARTCEVTGSPGVLMVRGGWYRTLDPAIAPEGYEVVSDEDEDE